MRPIWAAYRARPFLKNKQCRNVAAHACLSVPCPVYLASAWTFVVWRSCCSATLLFRASTSCRSAAECSISPSRRLRSDLEERAPQFRGSSPSPPRGQCSSSSLPTGSHRPQRSSNSQPGNCTASQGSHLWSDSGTLLL